MISHWSLPPAESDSANLDHVAELMVRSGTDPQEALMALVPEAYRNHPDLVKHYPEVGAGLCSYLLGCLVSGWAVFGQLLMRGLAAQARLGPNVPSLKPRQSYACTSFPQVVDFYEYYEGLQEGWDGPALLVFSDGKKVGCRLDRNGLRPARFWQVRGQPGCRRHVEGRACELRAGWYPLAAVTRRLACWGAALSGAAAPRTPYGSPAACQCLCPCQCLANFLL